VGESSYKSFRNGKSKKNQQKQTNEEPLSDAPSQYSNKSLEARNVR
jgi:hypothetical protein